jgi:hypothetical protein
VSGKVYFYPDSRAAGRGQYEPVVLEWTPMIEMTIAEDGERYSFATRFGSTIGASTIETAQKQLDWLLAGAGQDCERWYEDKVAALEVAKLMAARRASLAVRTLAQLVRVNPAEAHLLLGLPRGQDSVAQVERWKLGREPIPADVAVRLGTALEEAKRRKTMRRLGKRGGTAAAANLSADERSARARGAAEARWRK